MDILSKLRRLLLGNPSVVRSIEYDADGFTIILDGVRDTTVGWDDVRQIVACKQEQFSYDSICFGFLCEDSGVHHTIGEHEVDFEAFSRFVVARFPGFRTDWHAAVVRPPFAENWTIVWQAPRGEDSGP